MIYIVMYSPDCMEAGTPSPMRDQSREEAVWQRTNQGLP